MIKKCVKCGRRYESFDYYPFEINGTLILSKGKDIRIFR